MFVRFGEIPKNEKSKIHAGDVLVGYEEGVSVYEAIEINNKVKIIMPELSYSACVSLSGCIERKAYVVKGAELEQKGSDGEPLLKDIVIVRKLGTLKAMVNVQ